MQKKKSEIITEIVYHRLEQEFFTMLSVSKFHSSLLAEEESYTASIYIVVIRIIIYSQDHAWIAYTKQIFTIFPVQVLQYKNYNSYCSHNSFQKTEYARLHITPRDRSPLWPESWSCLLSRQGEPPCGPSLSPGACLPDSTQQQRWRTRISTA